jgi:hypothetical protein
VHPIDLARRRTLIVAELLPHPLIPAIPHAFTFIERRVARCFAKGFRDWRHLDFKIIGFLRELLPCFWRKVFGMGMNIHSEGYARPPITAGVKR